MSEFLSLADIANQLEQQVKNAKMGEGPHIRVSDPVHLVQSLRAAERQAAWMRESLELIRALKDGYQGGNTQYSEGRKAGYRVAGEIAERSL